MKKKVAKKGGNGAESDHDQDQRLPPTLPTGPQEPVARVRGSADPEQVLPTGCTVLWLPWTRHTCAALRKPAWSIQQDIRAALRSEPMGVRGGRPSSRLSPCPGSWWEPPTGGVRGLVQAEGASPTVLRAG